MQIKNLLVYILFILLLTLVSCQNENNNSSKDIGQVKELNLTMIAKNITNPTFLSAKVGAEKKAKELSEKYDDINIAINYQAPNIEDPLEQARMVRNSVQEKTDAIILSCSDAEILKEAIDFADSNSVPVMTYDSDSPDSKRFSFYGPNNEEIGEMLMKKIAELVAEKGQIAILAGNKNAPNLKKRLTGVLKEKNNYPNISIVGQFFNEENPDSATSKILEVNNKFPELKGWIMIGGWALFNNKLSEKIKPNKYKIVCVDALPVQLQYIENGLVQMMVGQPTFSWGAKSVEKVIDKIYLKEDVPDSLRMKLFPITKANLGGWSRQLRAWGYKNIPEKYFVL